MKPLFTAILAGALALTACQPNEPDAQKITILNGDSFIIANMTVSSPAALLIAAGMAFSPEDRVFVNGLPAAHNSTLADDAATIQVHHSVPITLVIEGQETVFNSSAPTVGQALAERGMSLRANDYLNPPADTPILGPMTINYRPASEVEIISGGESHRAITSAATVGEALAQAGIPLQGMDYSIPAETDKLPGDGRIRVVRVNESIALIQKSIPFNVEVQLTADLELDQQELLQAGEPGLAVTRTRIRYEDGQEVSQETDAESLVRPAKDRIVGAGTKIVIRTLDTPDGPIEYYRAVQVYATSYSPCRLGVPWCGYGTAGGLKAQKGVIGVIRSWWRYMNGDPVYVPGYGRAVISDIGAGIDGRYWIDLAYGDDDYVPWHSWTTLYFLTPVPPTIMYVLE
jgi:uncharacterized protein YabE (DUF348 family)